MKTKTKFITALLCAGFLILLYTNGNGFEFIAKAHAEEFDEVMKSLQSKWSLFIEMGVAVSFILYPIVNVLLDPKVFLDLTNVNDGNTLLVIWKLSRDIMNTIFAFMLIAGAMVTVVMAKQDYLKKYALKFFLGIILVNFSWFFPRVILDISHVLTANIYEIPSIIGTQCRVKDDNGTLQPCIYPEKFKFFPPSGFLLTEEGAGFVCAASNFVCYKPTQLSDDTNIASGIVSGLMMNHAKLPDLNKVLNTQTETTKDTLGKMQAAIAQLIRAGLQFLLVLYIALILVGMTIVLMIRIPILWMTMAFMPLMFIGFVVGDLMPQNFNTMNIFNKFVKAAFLPFVLAIPLTVGYIMINALAYSPPPPSVDILTEATGKILPGINNLWQLFWMLMTIIIMWKGFRMAMKLDEIFEQATSSVTQLGGNIGNIAKNLPLNIPFLPMGTDDNNNVQYKNIGQIGSGIAGLSQASAHGGLWEKGKSILEGEDVNKEAAKINIGDKTKQEITNIITTINSDNRPTNEALDTLIQAVKEEHKDEKPEVLARRIYNEINTNTDNNDKKYIEEEAIYDRIKAS